MFIEITSALGATLLVTLEGYLAMPLDALVGTRARLVTRRDLIARRAR